MSGTDDPDRDPFEELDRELRERVGGEFRRTAEEDEYTARKAALRKRDLAQVAYELLSRGDSVRVTMGTTTLRGVLVHARGSLATLKAPEGTDLHINLAGPAVIEVVARAAAGGRSREPYGPETFLARLRELELSGAPIEVFLGSAGGRPAGVIEAVAVDHVMLVGETTHFVPLAQIAAVRRLER